MSAGSETNATEGGEARKTRVRRWLFEACFPLWAAQGADPRGGFCERLALDGTPIEDPTSRVRVQARQTFVFATAATMGWERATALGLVRRGVDALLGPCRRPDGLFGKIVRPGRCLADAQPDLYDNAFCILGLAAASQALNDASLSAEADRTLGALDAQMAHRAGGYAESLPPRTPRRQNPHMHLLEAVLALEAAAPGRGYLQRADQIVALFDKAFFDPRTATLIEFFGDDWTPDRAAPFEPGHAFEWSWLLSRWAALKGGADHAATGALYAAARRFVDAQGFAPQSASADGGLVDATRRAWPQTEALKAHLVMRERAQADALLDAFFEVYLSGVAAGGWRDHFDAQGVLIASDIPASTGYHIVLAFTEYLKRP